MPQKRKRIIDRVEHLQIRKQKFMRYETLGDWYHNGTIEVYEKMSSLQQLAVGVHEMIEMILLHLQGVTAEQVTRWDTEDSNGQYDPAMYDKDARYKQAHRKAEFVEKWIIEQGGEDWVEYLRKTQDLTIDFIRQESALKGPEALITKQQVREEFNISLPILRYYVDRGVIPYKKINEKKLLFKRSDIQNLDTFKAIHKAKIRKIRVKKSFMTTKQIAQRINRSESTVTNLIHKHKTMLRPRREPNGVGGSSYIVSNRKAEKFIKAYLALETSASGNPLRIRIDRPTPVAPVSIGRNYMNFKEIIARLPKKLSEGRIGYVVMERGYEKKRVKIDGRRIIYIKNADAEDLIEYYRSKK